MKNNIGLLIIILFTIIDTRAIADENTEKIGLTYYNQFTENKTAFLEKSKEINLKNWRLSTDSWNHSIDKNLTTDLAFFENIQAPESSSTLFVISSGTHGIEGFVGSALQRWFIDQYIKTNQFKSDVLLVHAINPWGMQNKRRVDEMNIDLNRNFLSKAEEYQTKNEDYMKINSFINPHEKINLTYFHKLGFIYNSIQLILTYSIETLRKSILIGQYEQQQGLYFGGSRAAAIKENIDILLASDRLKKYKNILWIDLHTGYGERGRLHLLANDSHSTEGKNIQKVFKSEKIDFGNEKNFYKASGDLSNYITQKTNSSQHFNGIVFEYGTLDSQKTLGSIESLRRMVIENQLFHNGSENSESAHATRELFQNMFFPQDEDWKNSIILQTEKVLNNIEM